LELKKLKKLKKLKPLGDEEMRSREQGAGGKRIDLPLE